MSATSASEDVPLYILLNCVIRDRAALAHVRHANLGRAAMDSARAQVIASLEAYTGALLGLQLPVPYALRDELRIQLGAHRHGTGRDARG